MDKYINLLRKFDEENIDIFDYCFEDINLKGLVCGDTVLISKNLETNAERYCVGLEEYQHVKVTVGDITDLKNLSNRKQEHKARMKAYENASEIEDMVAAYNSGARNIYELAEFLGLTERFLLEASLGMQNKYGVYFKVGGYTVCFSPFEIYKDKIIGSDE